MPRIPRVDVGNLVYHVINRANGHIQIFHKDKDYLLFESVLAEAKELNGMRILAYCIMPNHWHLVLHPRKETGSGAIFRDSPPVPTSCYPRATDTKYHEK